jgi:2-polyprenyl-3-methyl-5-hydroxy-6-metoxy-1,4-benzoquinol methylase
MFDFKLAELRKRKGITQKELSNVLSVSMKTISKWETGVAHPDVSMLPMLSEYFGVSVDKLLGLVPLDEDYKPSNAGNKEYWEKRIAYLEKTEKEMWNEEYMRFLINEVWKIDKPVRILDCGCGYGALGLLLLPMLPKGSKYVGIDFSEKMIQEAKKRYDKERYDFQFIVSDILDFDEMEHYDIVVSQSLLRHVNNGKRMLYKMTDFLKPGGLLISIECNRQFEVDGLYISGMNYEYLCNDVGLKNMWIHQLKTQERDYAIAMKIPHYLHQVGFEDIGCRMNDKVVLIEPGMSNYKQALEDLVEVEEWLCSAAEDKRIIELMNKGMSRVEAKEFYTKQREISQHIKNNDELSIVKIRGLIVTYGRKTKK